MAAVGRQQGAPPVPGLNPVNWEQGVNPTAPTEAIPGMNVPIPDAANVRNSQAQMPPTSLNDASAVGPQLLDQQDQSVMGGMPGPLDTMTQPNVGRPLEDQEFDDLRNQVEEDLSRAIAGVGSPQDRVFPMAQRQGRGLRSFKEAAMGSSLRG